MSSESAVRPTTPATDESSVEWLRMCDLMAQTAEPFARFNARNVAVERLHDEYAGRAVAYREEWDGDDVRLVVVGTADTLVALLDALDPSVEESEERVTVAYLPGRDEIMLTGYSIEPGPT